MSKLGVVLNPNTSQLVPSDGSNNTTVALTGAATFTGTGELAPQDGVTVSCTTDAAGTLYFDFSPDGTNWGSFPSSGFTVAAGIHEYHTGKVNGRYFRVRLVNGSSAQSYLRLYTYYGPHTQPNSPLNQTHSLDADAILVKTSHQGLDVARNLWSGIRHIHKFGSGEVGTSYAPVTVGLVYPTPQAAGATTLRVKAGDTNDTAAGTGAREITLEGLDENFEEVTETLATAGTSASSATSATFTRLNRIYVSASGTYATIAAGSHAANVVIENSAGTEDWATINANGFPRGQGEIGIYTIPAGYTAYLEYAAVTVDSTKTAHVLGFFREGCDETAAPYSAMRLWVELGGVSGSETINPHVPIGPFVGPCDIGFMGKVTSSTAEIDVDFEIFLVAN